MNCGSIPQPHVSRDVRNCEVIHHPHVLGHVMNCGSIPQPHVSRDVRNCEMIPQQHV